MSECRSDVFDTGVMHSRAGYDGLTVRSTRELLQLNVEQTSRFSIAAVDCASWILADKQAC